MIFGSRKRGIGPKSGCARVDAKASATELCLRKRLSLVVTGGAPVLLEAQAVPSFAQAWFPNFQVPFADFVCAGMVDIQARLKLPLVSRCVWNPTVPSFATGCGLGIFTQVSPATCGFVLHCALFCPRLGSHKLGIGPKSRRASVDIQA